MTTAKVKNHSLVADDFKLGQLPGGTDEPLGARGRPRRAGARQWSGGIEPGAPNNGLVDVRFNRDVSGCALLTSPQAVNDWPGGQVSAYPATFFGGTSDVVRVVARTAAGAQTTTDLAFYLAVFC